ncbi:MAG: Sorbitol dehydrogenase, partial [uncultured Rubrobacteraceae bacterium]
AERPRRHLRRPRLVAHHPRGAQARGAPQGRPDPHRRLRGLRHRPPHPQRPLAPAAPLAVHARPRARRGRRRDRGRAGRGLHGPAPGGGVEGHAAPPHALRQLLLLRALPGDGQQVPHPRLLRPLPRLRQAPAPLGRVVRDGLRRPRGAAGDQDLQATRRHAAGLGRPLRAIDLVRPRLRPRPARRLFPRGRHRRHPGLRADRRPGRGRRPGDGGGPRHRRGGAREPQARALPPLRRRGDGLPGGPRDAGVAHRGRARDDPALRGGPRDGLLRPPLGRPRGHRDAARRRDLRRDGPVHRRRRDRDELAQDLHEGPERARELGVHRGRHRQGDSDARPGEGPVPVDGDADPLPVHRGGYRRGHPERPRHAQRQVDHRALPGPGRQL